MALDKCNPLVCLANRICIEDATDLKHFAYTIHNFDIKESKTYKKTIAFDQAEEWAKAIQQKM